MGEASAVAIVPARAGSKGVPGKNLAIVNGRPLIAYTIEAALAARGIERVIVTTDGADIACVSREWGAEVPFMRPARLAQDTTPGAPPILHALRWLDENEGYRPEYAAVLQPTSPLRLAEDIDGAIDLAIEKSAYNVYTLCEVEKHPHLMKLVDDSGLISNYAVLETPVTHRQQLSKVYAYNGAVHVTRREIFLERETGQTENSYAYVMPEDRSLEIDTPWHLHLAELILKDMSDARG